MALDEGIINSLPEDIRNEPSFAEIQKGDLPGVFKNLIDSQKTLGRAIILPDDKATPEEHAAKLNSVYDKLGRPKAHTEYDFKDVITEDAGIDPTRLEKFNKVFHEAGLSQGQAKRLVAAYLSDLSENSLDPKTAIQTLTQGDEKNPGWGEKFAENVGVAKLPLVKFDESGEITSLLEQTGLGNHPAVLRFFHKIGSQLTEDGTPGRVENRAGALDKGGAQSKIAAIQNDKNHPYHDRSKPGFKEAQAEMQKLFAIVYGDEVVAEVGTH
jgi:hypothetical protein